MASKRFEEVDEVVAVDGLVVDYAKGHAILFSHGGYHGAVTLVDVCLVDTEVRVLLSPVSFLDGELCEYDFV